MNQYKEHPASREQSLGFNESMVLNALELARTAGNEGRTVVLVEGISDQAAIDTLAKRLGRELEKEGITTVPIGGATKIWHFLEVLGRRGLKGKVAGLYDIGEGRYFRRAVERGGFGAELTRADMESLGFYVCAVDLEDELIRSLGAEMVLAVVAAYGDLWKVPHFSETARMVRPRSGGAASTLAGHNRAAETIVRKVVGECPGYESGPGAAGTFAGVCVEQIGRGW